MEGLELFAGSSPAERALAAKLQTVQEELNDYKEEHRYAEARVSAHAHILRLLEGESIPGMCSGCYLKLKRRVRALENEYLSPAALAAPPLKAESEQPRQNDEVEGQLAKGRKVEEPVVKPVRTARRIPRQVDTERANEGLAALAHIKVAPLQREFSTADSVTAVIDNTSLAAAVHRGGLEGDGLAAGTEESQEESQGEAEGDGHSASKTGGLLPNQTSGRVESAVPFGEAGEDSGDCSVNGALKEGERAGLVASGQSPVDRSEYKSVVDNDASSEEGSTARAEGEPLENGMGGSLSRVVNLSNKSAGSSCSSIMSPTPGPEKALGSERGEGSEGPAESEWKDAIDGQIEDEDDLLDDGDSKAPVLNSPPMEKGAVAKQGDKAEAGSDSVSQAGEKVESAGMRRHADPPSGDGGREKSNGEEGPAGGTISEPNTRVLEREGTNETVEHPEDGGDESSRLREGGYEKLFGDGTKVAGHPEGAGVYSDGKEGVAEGESSKKGQHTSAGGQRDGDDVVLSQKVEEPESRLIEAAADPDDINVDELAVDELKSEAGSEKDGLQAGGGGTPLVRGPPIRRRVAPTFTLFAALKDAARTTQEGQSIYEKKQERMDRLLKLKAERDKEAQEARLAARGNRTLAEATRADPPAWAKVVSGQEDWKPSRMEAESGGAAEPAAIATDPASQGGLETGVVDPPAPGKNFLQAVAGGQAPAEGAPSEVAAKRMLTSEQRKARVDSKRDFVYMERDRSTGRMVNILQGLELHKNVLSLKEQEKLVEKIHAIQEHGRAGQLRPRTYTQPRKWMRGKGRVTIQFGCCYNYAVDSKGNPPGILRDEEVDPIPPMIESIITRLVKWDIMPAHCRPDSCIVNIYDEGDCIPPHIDHHDFLRPFCTLSLLTEADIVFGTRLEAVGEGEFEGPVRISLPVGSVLILNGNGADVARHCIPGVPAKRISITLRKMDPAKAPYHLTEKAIHTPLPGPPLPPPPPRIERGSASDSWRKAPESQGTHTRFASPAPGTKQGDETAWPNLGGGSSKQGDVEAWPELGGMKRQPTEGGGGAEGPDSGPKGAWAKRQEERAEVAGITHSARSEAVPENGDHPSLDVHLEQAPLKAQLLEAESERVGKPVEIDSGNEKQDETNSDEMALEVKLTPSDSVLGGKALASKLSAQAPPFEAPPKRLASPTLESLGPPKKIAPYEKAAPSRGSLDSPPRFGGTSTSLTSSPAKKWASTTETPVAAASDLAMAVQKMVGGEGTKAGRRVEVAQRPELGLAEAVQRRGVAPSEQQGLGLSAAAREFAPPKREAGVQSHGGGLRPQSGDVERRPKERAADPSSLIDESASWADIDVDSGSPHRGGWQQSARGNMPGRFDRPLERPVDRTLDTFEVLEKRQRKLEEIEHALEMQHYLQREGRVIDARLREAYPNSGGFLEQRPAERFARVGFASRFDNLQREPAGGLQRWGHDDRGLGREPIWVDHRRDSVRAQDDVMYGVRGGRYPREEASAFRDGALSRRGHEQALRGDQLVTHPKAEALREAGGW